MSSGTLTMNILSPLRSNTTSLSVTIVESPNFVVSILETKTFRSTPDRSTDTTPQSRSIEVFVGIGDLWGVSVR